MTAVPVATHHTLVISEVFGPTAQGEGPSVGRRCSFIRTGGCDLACRWCDTPYTWDARRYDLRQELTRTPVADIVAKVAGHDTGMVVITGGEPLLHQKQPGWRALLAWLHRRAYRIEAETNATVAPDDFTALHVTAFNASPKLANSGEPADRRINPAAIAALARADTAWKFVCRTVADVDEAAALAAAHNLPRHRVWIMPEGTSTEVLGPTMARIAGHAIASGFNITPRLHVEVWGSERGH